MSKSDVNEIQGALWIIVALLAHITTIKWVMWVGIVFGALSLLGSILAVETKKPNSTILDAMYENNKRA